MRPRQPPPKVWPYLVLRAELDLDNPQLVVVPGGVIAHHRPGPLNGRGRRDLHTPRTTRPETPRWTGRAVAPRRPRDRQRGAATDSRRAPPGRLDIVVQSRKIPQIPFRSPAAAERRRRRGGGGGRAVWQRCSVPSWIPAAAHAAIKAPQRPSSPPPCGARVLPFIELSWDILGYDQ